MEISNAERRRRLVRRHHLGRTAPHGMQAVRDVVAFHSSDPVTPYLGMRARLPGFRIYQLDRLLWEERTLWRMHGMRGTLFVAPAREGGVILAATARPVAARERARLEGWLAPAIGTGSAAGWLDSAARDVMAVLEQGGEWRTREVAAAVPEIDRKVVAGSGKWAAEVAVPSRLLLWMGLEGRVVRTRPAGSWRSSQYRWAATSVWFETPPSPLQDVAEARATLAREYVATHGPITLSDLRWWAGWTARDSRAALHAIDAVAVTLEDGAEGFVLESDREAEEPWAAAVAFLPGLDPTPMGWKERDWYLGPHGRFVFDSNGNAGPTVWVGGRIVGGWGQRQDGSVVYELLEEVDAPTAEMVDEEATALQGWLDGQVVSVRFRSPLERKLAGR